MNPFNKYSPLFEAYDDGHPSRLKTWLVRVGKMSFGASVVAGAVVMGWGGAAYQDQSIIAHLLLFIFPVGFIIGFLSFALLGIQYVGRNQGKKSLAGSIFLVVGKVFLYILLPSLLIGGALVAWTYLTHQGMFQ